MFKEIISNNAILTLIITYFSVNILKIFFKFIKSKKFDPLLFFKTGGMPSAHSATVMSVSVAIYLNEGATNVFALSLIFALVVIIDSLGVRHATDKHAHVINQIIDELKEFKNKNPLKLSEFIGHTPTQVLVGTIFGIIVPLVLHYYIFR